MVRTRRNPEPPPPPPPPQEGGEQGGLSPTMAQVLDSLRLMTESLKEWLCKREQVPPGIEEASGHNADNHLQDFHIEPPVFSGGINGELAETWLAGMEMYFRFKECSSNEKAQLAIFQLNERALLWWRNEEHLGLTLSTVTWEVFEERFRKKYLSALYIQSLAIELHSLRQGDQTVAEYETRFMQLLERVRYLNKSYLNEEEKMTANMFISGLNQSIGSWVRIFETSTLRDSVRKALIIEEDQRRTDAESNFRALATPRASGSRKGKRTFSKGGSSRPPQLSRTDASSGLQRNPRRSQSPYNRPRSPQARNLPHQSQLSSTQSPSYIACWTCAGPHYQRDCPARQFQSQ